MMWLFIWMGSHLFTDVCGESEGLRYTTTGSKDLPGGRRVHLMVAITNNQGVILAEPYEKMTGEYFADFVRRKLPGAFIDARIGSRKFRAAKLFVMDNDPLQNSKAAREAIDEIRATLVKIQARSSDPKPHREYIPHRKT